MATDRGKPVRRATTSAENGGPGDQIHLYDEVISAIVRKYSLEVPGVVRLAPKSLVGGLAEMIGRKSADSNILVESQDGQVVITVDIVVAFGTQVPEVAATVQEVIRNRVREMTGKTVQRVTVNVRDMDEPAKPLPPTLPGLG